MNMIRDRLLCLTYGQKVNSSQSKHIQYLFSYIYAQGRLLRICMYTIL